MNICTFLLVVFPIKNIYFHSLSLELEKNIILSKITILT